MTTLRYFPLLKSSTLLVLLISAVSWLSSCDPKEPSGECFVMTNPSECGGTVDLINDTLSFVRPCFNPNNSTEFVFQTWDGKVLKYDLVSEQYTTLFNGPSWSTANWSRTGWLVLGSAGEIVKFKDDGTGLTYLTTSVTEGAYFPNWNYPGDKILYYSSNGFPTFVILMTDSGIKMDTLSLFPNSLSEIHNRMYGCIGLPDSTMVWAPSFSGLVAFQHFDEINLLPLHDFVISSDDNGSDKISDMDYIPGTYDVIWASDNGIYRTNLLTYQTTTVKENCDSKKYQTLSVSSDGSKLLAGVRRYEKINNCTYNVVDHIYIMNIDGSSEQDLNMPSY